MTKSTSTLNCWCYMFWNFIGSDFIWSKNATQFLIECKCLFAVMVKCDGFTLAGLISLGEQYPVNIEQPSIFFVCRFKTKALSKLMARQWRFVIIATKRIAKRRLLKEKIASCDKNNTCTLISTLQPKSELQRKQIEVNHKPMFLQLLINRVLLIVVRFFFHS